MSEWMPIESAPTHNVGSDGYGNRVLLCVDCGSGTVPSCRIGWWDGFVWAYDDSKSFRDLGYRVTHWMPLPNPPGTDEEESE